MVEELERLLEQWHDGLLTDRELAMNLVTLIMRENVKTVDILGGE